MRRTTMRPLAVAGALSLAFFLPGTAFGQDGGFAGEGSGSATVEIDEDSNEADVSIDWQGLAAEIPDLSGTEYEELSNMPFPHAQHFHGTGQGQCPTPEDDEDGNGVVDTPEGQPAYGPVVTSLTEEDAGTSPDETLDVDNFPAGDSASYNRTIELSDEAADEVRGDNAVVVIHGLNPEIMPGESALEPSPLDDGFPLAATAPALCGELNDQGDGTFTADLQPTNPAGNGDQVDEVPEAAPEAGGGSTAGNEAMWLFSIGGLALAGAVTVGVVAVRKNGLPGQG